MTMMGMEMEMTMTIMMRMMVMLMVMTMVIVVVMVSLVVMISFSWRLSPVRSTLRKAEFANVMAAAGTVCGRRAALLD